MPDKNEGTCPGGVGNLTFAHGFVEVKSLRVETVYDETIYTYI